MIAGGASPTRAAAGVVALHGRAGSGADILGLLAVAGLPDVAGLAPEAPGRSWWPTSFLAPMAQMEPFAAAGVVAAAQAVERLEAAGLSRGRIWLMGFSQGACLALETFARAGEGLAGVLAFSGGLVGTADAGTPTPALYGHADKLLAYPGRREGAQVWLSVHERDPHIPLKRAQDSAAALRAMGAAGEFQAHPGAGHGVTQADVTALRAALNRPRPPA
ncbi:MAG TPA: dienelactone hydrolase family protein [Paracoccaceae bacterium]|nr:dienelactone hydrolase family protein [Paracoccaceae bacterium]